MDSEEIGFESPLVVENVEQYDMLNVPNEFKNSSIQQN
jgi:hypothetical protein